MSAFNWYALQPALLALHGPPRIYVFGPGATAPVAAAIAVAAPADVKHSDAKANGADADADAEVGQKSRRQAKADAKGATDVALQALLTRQTQVNAQLSALNARLAALDGGSAEGDAADAKAAAAANPNPMTSAGSAARNPPSSGNTVWTAAQKAAYREQKAKGLSDFAAAQAVAAAAGAGAGAPQIAPEPNTNALDPVLMAEIREMMGQKYIVATRHATLPLVIYNYNQRCQFDKKWNAATMACRGLILDTNGCVVARPFTKFFNFGEIPIPDAVLKEKFVAYDKMDGSLGVTYWFGGQPYIATRGSFDSEQSAVATRMLRTEYAECWPKLKRDNSVTYLFEIIYPENRIVVDYGQDKKLVLLAAIDTRTGRDVLPLPRDTGFPVVQSFDDLKDFKAVQQMEAKNREGFVVRFDPSGVRCKIKFAEYKKLHHMKSSVSSTTIWQALMAKGDVESLLEALPDEMFKWVKDTAAKLNAAVADLRKAVDADVDRLLALPGMTERKAQAVWVTKNLTTQRAGLVFGVLDVRSKPADPKRAEQLRQKFWAACQPKHEAPAGAERDPNAD